MQNFQTVGLNSLTATSPDVQTSVPAAFHPALDRVLTLVAANQNMFQAISSSDIHNLFAFELSHRCDNFKRDGDKIYVRAFNATEGTGTGTGTVLRNLQSGEAIDLKDEWKVTPNLKNKLPREAWYAVPLDTAAELITICANGSAMIARLGVHDERVTGRSAEALFVNGPGDERTFFEEIAALECQASIDRIGAKSEITLKYAPHSRTTRFLDSLLKKLEGAQEFPIVGNLAGRMFRWLQPYHLERLHIDGAKDADNNIASIKEDIRTTKVRKDLEQGLQMLALWRMETWIADENLERADKMKVKGS